MGHNMLVLCYFKAIEYDNVGFLKRHDIASKFHNFEFCNEIFECAIAHNSEHCLNFMFMIPDREKYIVENNIMGFAARHGNTKIVDLMIENGYSLAKLNIGIAKSAVKHGQIDFVKYLMNKGFRLSRDCFNLAIRQGQFNIAKILYDAVYNKHQNNYKAFMKAVSKPTDQTDSLIYLLDKASIWYITNELLFRVITYQPKNEKLIQYLINRSNEYLKNY
jgi:hypothetical protein